jgi:hypothetical protein
VNGTSDSLGEPSIDEVEARMRPGAFSQGGFLGPNERCAMSSRRMLRHSLRYGVGYEQIASGLHDFDRARARVAGEASARWVAVHGSRRAVQGISNVSTGQARRISAVHHRWRRTIRVARLEGCRITAQPAHAWPGIIVVHLIRVTTSSREVDAPYRLDPSTGTRLLELSSDQ